MVGLRKSWRHDQYVLCANEDISYSPSAIERFYSKTFPLFVSLRFNGLDGYGWVFPKPEYICVTSGSAADLDRTDDQIAGYATFICTSSRTNVDIAIQICPAFGPICVAVHRCRRKCIQVSEKPNHNHPIR